MVRVYGAETKYRVEAFEALRADANQRAEAFDIFTCVNL